jgi:hypothetical protein
MGMLNVVLDVSTPGARALLRGHAYAAGRTVDNIAGHWITAQELRVASNQ